MSFCWFSTKNRPYSQNFNNNTFFRPPVTSARFTVGFDNHPDNSILIKYDNDVYSRGCGRIKEAFRALIKDDILNHIYMAII